MDLGGLIPFPILLTLRPLPISWTLPQTGSRIPPPWCNSAQLAISAQLALTDAPHLCPRASALRIFSSCHERSCLSPAQAPLLSRSAEARANARGAGHRLKLTRSRGFGRLLLLRRARSGAMRRPRRQSPHAGIGTISVGTTSMQCVLRVGRLLVRRRSGHLRLSVIDSCTALRSSILGATFLNAFSTSSVAAFLLPRDVEEENCKWHQVCWCWK